MVQTTDNQTELFYHVDDHDNELGSITRAQAHDGSKKPHRSAAILVMNPEKTKVLLQQRSLTKDTNPGYWTISVGGHLTYGDNYEHAAVRELAEEVGLHTPIKLLKKVRIEDSLEVEWCAIFETESDEHFPFQLHPEEVQRVQWVPITDLRAFMEKNSFAPFGKDVILAIFS